MPKLKVKKFRGSRTCGGGSHKKRRGAGHRGGRGNAGVHKHKYLKFLKLERLGLYEFGDRGFTRPRAVVKEINQKKIIKETLRSLRDEGKLDDSTYRFLYSKVDLNVGDLSKIIENLAKLGIAEKRGEKYLIDLSVLGYSKLLGAGSVNKAIEVKVESATPKAMEKLKSAGGGVV
ncbi:MAG: uL15 family ribosomal protein [Archaeoglobaceae archaeon]|nr:uL15 family ribosomal protein [Archaeoglobaceae archaeon]MDW8118707.1 uL15 family ribosomal protein [Archaeoglobaceae archaeon]